MVGTFLGGDRLSAVVVCRAIPGAGLLAVLRVAFKIGSFIVTPGVGIVAGVVSGGQAP